MERPPSATDKETELRRQIAALQAQLEDSANASQNVERKRKRDQDVQILVPSSPKKKRQEMKQPDKKPVPLRTESPAIFVEAPPSKLLAKLASLRARDTASEEEISRSTSFKDLPAVVPPYNGGLKRDGRLNLVEELEVGPVNHTAPFDDPNFERLEPNSGIKLSSRTLPHDDLQDYLRGRYFLSPSRLYGAIRLTPDRRSYDVSVPGDWVTIAVVAKRGPLKTSKAPVALAPDDKSSRKGKTKPEEKLSGKRYVNITLVDFGTRSGSSATGGKSTIGGDAQLSLLLFESDGFDIVKSEDGSKPRKLYKGGSKGAYEALFDLAEGDVIAILNPRVLKPFQRSADSPHPQTNILAITPQSSDSIISIGRCPDLGLCTAVKRDNKHCMAWFDKRVGLACEMHVQQAVQRVRAGRAEFASGTSGMSTEAKRKSKPAYDPSRQWGLKPTTQEQGEPTYIVSGHIVGTSSMFVSENLGREGQAKAKRKKEAHDSDKALLTLLSRDKEGSRTVMRAQEVLGKNVIDKQTEPPPTSAELSAAEAKRNAFSATVIRNLGFDPTATTRNPRQQADLVMKQKIESLTVLQTNRKEVELGPRPGPRIRSGVFLPPTNSVLDSEMIDLDDI